MEKIIETMKKYGVILPPVGVGSDEIEKALKNIKNSKSHGCDFDTRHAAYEYVNYLIECDTRKTCIADKIKVYTNIWAAMCKWRGLFSACTVDCRAWNSTIENELLKLVNKYLEPGKNGLVARIYHKKEYSNFELYLESEKFYEKDDRYMRIDIISVHGDKDYKSLFFVPFGKKRPVFNGDTANYEMDINAGHLYGDIKKLEYALMYGESIIKQINAYMKIVDRLYKSLPYEYTKVYGNKIKKVYFY